MAMQYTDIKSVEVSGTVGKQTFATTAPTILMGVVLTPAASAAVMTIRDGNASGDVKLVVRTSDTASKSVEGLYQRFDKGMHVKVLGANAVGYLVIQ